MKTKYIAAVLLLICFVMIAANGYTGEVRIVQGSIENVRGNSIEVHGKYYDISGVPLLNSSGQEATKDLLQAGKIAEISLEDGKIIRVLIYDYMVE